MVYTGIGSVLISHLTSSHLISSVLSGWLHGAVGFDELRSDEATWDGWCERFGSLLLLLFMCPLNISIGDIYWANCQRALHYRQL